MQPKFRFRDVYVVTAPPGDYNGIDIAVGVRVVEGHVNPGTKQKERSIEWLAADGSFQGGHTLFGDVVKAENDITEVQDTSIEEGEVFRFEPLTMSLWKKLLDGGFIRASDSLAAITDIGILKNALIQDVLEEWWVEEPEDVW